MKSSEIYATLPKLKRDVTGWHYNARNTDVSLARAPCILGGGDGWRFRLANKNFSNGIRRCKYVLYVIASSDSSLSQLELFFKPSVLFGIRFISPVYVAWRARTVIKKSLLKDDEWRTQYSNPF